MKPTKHARHKLVRVREFMLYKRKTSKFVRRFTFCTWIFTHKFKWFDRQVQRTKRQANAYTSFYRGLCDHAMKPVDKASLRLRKKYMKGQKIADRDRFNGVEEWAYFNPYTEEFEERCDITK